MWDNITFAQLLLYTEDMQSQQRAENGIKEIVLGYIGHEQKVENDLGQNVDDLATALDGSAIITNMSDLPDDMRAMLLAENHRKKTGQIRPIEDFMPMKVVE